jgi:membrane fusion protein, copper/silver efflux system
MSIKIKRTFVTMLVMAVLGAAAVWAWKSDLLKSRDDVALSGEKTLYTCGMHPQVIQDHPGNCSICGMKLTPVRKQAAGAAAATGEKKIKYYKSTMMAGEVRPTPGKDSMGMDMVPVYEDEAAAAESTAIAVDPVTTQNMGIRTALVGKGPLRRTIRTVGNIDYNESSLADVTTKFKGWIEKLNVNTTGQLVMRGDPLFEIYSPDLYSAQVEYLLATDPTNKATAENVSTKASATTKLKFFDISDQQIAELEKSRQATKTLRILAHQDGFVVDKMVVQGQMVDAGMKIYRLADLGTVWVQAQIYEQDLPYLKLGQEAAVTLSNLPDREFRGRVTYVYPNVDEKTRTTKVRMEFHNPGYFLKPGMFATVHIEAELSPSALLIPDMAILRSGERTTVFVALEGGKFEPRTVVLGPQSEGDMYQVLSGLSEGERIVTSGQFMLDSESQLREAIQKMLKPKTAGEAGPAATQPSGAATTQAAAPVLSASAGPVKYICPMPEHVSIEYDHAGNCPICGMTLVPVSASSLQKLHPGGKVLYYTCPMPEHSDVHQDKPGKCPKCGMTLIPVMETAPIPEAREGTAAVPISQAVQAPTTQNAAAATRLYTCPMEMHADVVSDKPGNCPKCGMELVPTGSVPHGKTAEAKWRELHAPTSQPSHEH